MRILLLSGGSGKRLWPLSNDARSKQFLKLLKSPDGKRESMVQRIVRQIKESGLDASITIATSVSQKDAITSQLGSHVDVVTEPERRDTFPAIALSTVYLLKEQHCDRNEVVVVMPIDPYTEESYFHTVGQMAQIAAQGRADLVLMGISRLSLRRNSVISYPISKKKETEYFLSCVLSRNPIAVPLNA